LDNHPDRRMPEYRYSLDRSDRIRSVSPEWVAFAIENGAPGLTESGVLGHRLWDFITDRQTRYLYELILAKVRRDGGSITLPFRCDAPDRRRYMRLKIARGDQGGLDFVSTLVREEPRDAISLFEAPASVTGTVKMCSWCKQVETPEAWVEVEAAIERLDLLDRLPVPRISHGICPACQGSLEASISA
jgi:hypothetical protein